MRGRKKRDPLWNDWRWQLQHAIRRVSDLPFLAWATPDRLAEWQRVTARYPLAITPYYLDLADCADASDPILRQCLPDACELAAGHRPDPFEELGSTSARGVVQRYPDRALVLVSASCGVACRHCTRKNLLQRERHVQDAAAWQAACEAIRMRPAVREVILSGGDPLLLETETLDGMLRDLHAIPHVEVIRIGTRVPVVLPMRIDGDMAAMLASHRPLWVNTQFNHPAELTPAALEACEHLVRRGIPVSNQAVLLRGINDSVDTLRDLCNGLQRNMIRPYYVFLCDPVEGTGHFHTTVAEGLALSEALRGAVGGLAMPRFVADVPGAAGKVPLEWLGKGGARYDGCE